MAEDPGGPAGERRTRFRRYVASVDQHDPKHLDRLGDALGALIEEVAAAKEDYLMKAAERDGFFFADGAFRLARTAPSSFAVTHVENLAFIDDRGRRLHLLASDNPKDAIGGAKELVESVCRTVLRLIGEPAPGKTANLVDITKSALSALELVPADVDDARKGAALAHKCLQQLSAFGASLGELRNLYGSGHGRDGKWKGLSARHARLVVGAGVTFAAFVAETYVERAALKNG